MPVILLYARVGILEFGKYTYILRKHSKLDLLKPKEIEKDDTAEPTKDNNVLDKD